MKERIEKLRIVLKERGIDAYMSFKPFNRRYISGFTGSAGYAIISADKLIFATDGRYTETSLRECTEYETVKISSAFTIFDLLRELNFKALAIEEDFVTLKMMADFKRELPNIKFIFGGDIITDMRMIKSDAEVSSIIDACRITGRSFMESLNYAKKGMKENEFNDLLIAIMKKNGSEGLSFNPIVVSGARTSLPHSRPTDKEFEDGDFVTIDMGAVYNGYCSDMTRTFVIGKANEQQKEIYDVVRQAQQRAMDFLKPGVTGFEADKVARDYIESRGYGKYFIHLLGHSLGLRCSEPPLLINDNEGNIVLQPNMVVTNEPGIYIAGIGGVRIEDTVLITKSGCKALTTPPTKELMEI